MTNYFNFLGLPLVVQDLITNEIVHNSIPEDRIQFALTSKYCNELVQRAKPKKIIDQFCLGDSFLLDFCAYSRRYYKTKEQSVEILPNCQIKQIELRGDYSRISDMLLEATRFATKLDIIFPYHFDEQDEVVGFYVKLKHLKSVTLKNPGMILPYYPSKVKLELGYYPPKYFLDDLAKKSQSCPLSVFVLEGRFSLEESQQFLQTAKFSTGAEIRIWKDYSDFSFYLIYLDQNIFTSEMFSKNPVPVFISQKHVGENRRILKLKRTSFSFEITFNVISALNPDKNYFSGVLKENRQLFILENIDQDEILIVKFASKMIKYYNGNCVEYSVYPRYSAKMMESTFPTTKFTTPLERVEKINNVLGTNIQLIQTENFVQSVELFCKIQDSASSGYPVPEFVL